MNRETLPKKYPIPRKSIKSHSDENVQTPNSSFESCCKESCTFLESLCSSCNNAAFLYLLGEILLMSTEPTKVFSLFAFFFMFNFRRKKEALEQQRSRFLAPSKDPSFTSFEASAIKFPIPLGVVKAPRLPAFTSHN